MVYLNDHRYLLLYQLLKYLQIFHDDIQIQNNILNHQIFQNKCLHKHLHKYYFGKSYISSSEEFTYYQSYRNIITNSIQFVRGIFGVKPGYTQVSGREYDGSLA